MKPLFHSLSLAFLLLASCTGNSPSEKEQARLDSLSRAAQRRSADSLKHRNPLLILPPDSTYTGNYVDKYPDGITKFKGFFRFGQRHGQWVSFYPTGIPWSEMHYDKGLRHGPNITWFENGKKRYEGVYRNDAKDSIWLYYDTTGKLAQRILFKENRIVRELPLE